MQKDMHYFGVYALARAAGMKANATEIVATASQYVDDAIWDKEVFSADGRSIIAAGIAFGPFRGVCYAVFGALLGAIIGFYIARFLGREWMDRFMKGHLSFCGACSDRLLFWVVLTARLLPVVSFGLASYAAGLTAMRLPAYSLATLIGMQPAGSSFKPA